MKVLVTRTDRLGDVLLSLPALEYLREHLPDASITFQCRPELHALLRPHFDRLGVTLAAEAPFAGLDAALFLFAPGERLYRAFREGVPLRVGARSKPASWLWLNRGPVQRRSRGTRSEALYNLELARALLAALGRPAPEPGEFRIRLEGTPEAREEGDRALKGAGVEGRFLAVHPGMGGSALNAPPERYAQILALWRGPVVATVGPSPWDRRMAEALGERYPDLKRIEGLSLSALGEVFRRAALVVAPSTGPLHLAHFVGAPTVGLYPPVRSQRPARWAPWGGAGRGLVLSPDVPCPGKRDCVGSRCPHYLCMDRLDWAGLLSSRGGALIHP